MGTRRTRWLVSAALVAAGLGVASPAAAATYTLKVKADTTVRQMTPTQNYGREPLLVLEHDETAGGRQTVILLKFDHTKITVKRAEDIRTARLWLRTAGGRRGWRRARIKAYALYRPFSETQTVWESDVAWRSFQPHDAYPGESSTTTVEGPDASSRWLYLDVTNLVREWYRGRPNHGFGIDRRYYASDARHGFAFFSKESAEAANPDFIDLGRLGSTPQLIIETETVR